MVAEFIQADAGARAIADSLSVEWERLCAEYLPVVSEGSIWRYSRGPAPSDAEQGWKLHVSATVLSANEILKRIAPPLRERGAQFKGPSSLRELQRLNSGLFYGYSQVGKFVTVYPRSAEEAVVLARLLHVLTRSLPAPAVPFDRRYRPDSPVFYRYGSFRRLEVENVDGTRAHALRDPDGRLVADVRAGAPSPEWVSDPFVCGGESGGAATAESPLATTYRVFQALTQRGKGGVYKALDLGAFPPRLCIVKEGRAGGETAWDGRDGRWRTQHEERVLSTLRAAGVEVPRVYSSFEAGGNHYLVTEYVEGESLQSLLNRRQRRLSLAQVFRHGVCLSRIISGIHAAGWAWRDCKPANVIITPGGGLRPLDFEGACTVEQPDPQSWGTPGYTAPSSPDAPQTGVQGDLYALGAFIYFVLMGRLPESSPLSRGGTLRRGTPVRVCRLIERLLSPEPLERPEASSVAEELTEVLAAVGASGLCRRAGRREVEAARQVNESRI